MQCKLCKKTIDEETYAFDLTSGDVMHDECKEDYFMNMYYDEFYKEWLDHNVVHKSIHQEV